MDSSSSTESNFKPYYLAEEEKEYDTAHCKDMNIDMNTIIEDIKIRISDLPFAYQQELMEWIKSTINLQD